MEELGEGQLGNNKKGVVSSDRWRSLADGSRERSLLLLLLAPELATSLAIAGDVRPLRN